MFDSDGFIRCFPFQFLNPLENLPFLLLFLSFALAGNSYIHVSQLASYLLALFISIRQVGLICWVLSNQVFQFYAESLFLVFVQLILSVTCIYLLITVQFIATYPKMFLLFFSLINLELGLKPFLDSYLGVFCS